MQRDHTAGPDPIPNWLTADDLIALGYDEALVARLPVRDTGRDGRPCWRDDELPDLLALAEREGRT